MNINIISRLFINILHVILGIYLYYINKNKIDEKTYYVYFIIILFALFISINNRLNINDYYSMNLFNINMYTQLIKILHIILILIVLFYPYKINEHLIAAIGVYVATHHSYKIYEKYIL